jgi:hypothetical protein
VDAARQLRRFAITGAVSGGLILLITVATHRALANTGLSVRLEGVYLHGRRRTSALTRHC